MINAHTQQAPDAIQGPAYVHLNRQQSAAMGAKENRREWYWLGGLVLVGAAALGGGFLFARGPQGPLAFLLLGMGAFALFIGGVSTIAKLFDMWAVSLREPGSQQWSELSAEGYVSALKLIEECEDCRDAVAAWGEGEEGRLFLTNRDLTELNRLRAASDARAVQQKLAMAVSGPIAPVH